MKNVLVPVDGLESTDALLPLLMEVCTTGDTVVLLSVKQPQAPERLGGTPGEIVRGGLSGSGVMGVVRPDVSIFAESKDQLTERQFSEAQDDLQSVAVQLREAHLKVRCEVIIGNDPANEIIRNARDLKPAFIAMHNRTHPGLTERFFGSVAERVIKAEVAPVLLIPR